MVKATISLLCKSTSNIRKKKTDEVPEKYLKNITHLYLNGKHIDEIGSEIAICKALKVLYLYENEIKSISHLACLTQLTHLYLQNNNIHRIENLNSLKNLQKLFLSQNFINVVEGLEELTCLEDLRIDSQRLAPGETLIFDDNTLHALANNLKRLDVSRNNIKSFRDFAVLSALNCLSAEDNNVKSLRDIISLLGKLPKLSEIYLRGNPVLNRPKACDAIIIHSKTLAILNGKAVTHVMRTFLEKWNEHREINIGISDPDVSDVDTSEPTNNESQRQETDESLLYSDSCQLVKISKHHSINAKGEDTIEYMQPIKLDFLPSSQSQIPERFGSLARLDEAAN